MILHGTAIANNVVKSENVFELEAIFCVKWLRGGFSDSPLKNRVRGDVLEASTILIHASSLSEGKVYRLFLI